MSQKTIGVHLISTDALSIKHMRPEEFADKIFLNSKAYERLFGVSYGHGELSKPWRRGIVKLQSESGATCYRMYAGSNKLKSTQAAVTFQTLAELNLSVKQGGEANVSKASHLFGKIIFYWQNPTHSTRISFKSAIILGAVFFIINLPTTFACDAFKKFILHW